MVKPNSPRRARAPASRNPPARGRSAATREPLRPASTRVSPEAKTKLTQ